MTETCICKICIKFEIEKNVETQIKQKGGTNVTKEQTIEAMKILAEKAGIKFTVEEVKEEGFKNGENYYYIDSRGEIFSDHWGDMPTDRKRAKYGNAFKTKTDAKKARFDIKLHNKLRMFAEEVNEGWEPDWTNHDEIKYFCLCNERDNDWFVTGTYYLHYINEVYFKTEKLAQRAIDKIIIPAYEEKEKENE